MLVLAQAAVPPTLASPATWAFTQAQVVAWVLVATRMTGLLATFPVLGAERVPVQLRAALVALMAFIITPVVTLPRALPDGVPALVTILAQEMAVGALLGTVAAWVMEAVAFAGQLMDTQMGFSFVQLVDPVNAQPASISGSMLGQLAGLMLLVTGLHHRLILALVESYRTVPVGQALAVDAMGMVAVMGQILARGVQLAFPVLAVLFLVDLALGISGRFMPQLQLLQLSFPVKIAIGLLVFGFVLRELGGWLEPMLEAAPKLALQLMGRGR